MLTLLKKSCNIRISVSRPEQAEEKKSESRIAVCATHPQNKIQSASGGFEFYFGSCCFFFASVFFVASGKFASAVLVMHNYKCHG